MCWSRVLLNLCQSGAAPPPPRPPLRRRSALAVAAASLSPPHSLFSSTDTWMNPDSSLRHLQVAPRLSRPHAHQVPCEANSGQFSVSREPRGESVMRKEEEGGRVVGWRGGKVTVIYVVFVVRRVRLCARTEQLTVAVPAQRSLSEACRTFFPSVQTCWSTNGLFAPHTPRNLKCALDAAVRLTLVLADISIQHIFPNVQNCCEINSSVLMFHCTLTDLISGVTARWTAGVKRLHFINAFSWTNIQG